MEESIQFRTYQETLRAKNEHCCNALLSRLIKHHGDAFVRPAPVVVIEAPPPPPPLLRVEIAPEMPPEPACAAPAEEDEPRKPTIKEIQKCISKHFDVSMNDLLSSRRFAKIVRPRQIGFYLARKLTLKSMPEIGRRFGGKDHTTVLHAIKLIDRRITEDPALARTIAILEAQFT